MAADVVFTFNLKAYVVIEENDEIDDGNMAAETAGVFSSIEKAREWISTAPRDPGRRHYDIEIWTLDEPTGHFDFLPDPGHTG